MFISSSQIIISADVVGLQDYEVNIGEVSRINIYNLNFTSFESQFDTYLYNVNFSLDALVFNQNSTIQVESIGFKMGFEEEYDYSEITGNLQIRTLNNVRQDITSIAILPSFIKRVFDLNNIERDAELSIKDSVKIHGEDRQTEVDLFFKTIVYLNDGSTMTDLKIYNIDSIQFQSTSLDSKPSGNDLTIPTIIIGIIILSVVIFNLKNEK